jgi:hypothetical protein
MPSHVNSTVDVGVTGSFDVIVNVPDAEPAATGVHVTP